MTLTRTEPRRFVVTDHGIASDGTTNATTAIHALRTLAGSGATLVFKKGTYLHSGLTLNVADQVWEFEPGATLTLADSANVSSVIISAAGVTLRGGTIEGNGANQTGGRGVSISADSVRVERVAVTNTKSYGIYAGNTSKTRIVDCTVTDSGSIGIFVEVTSSATTDDADVVIQGNTVDRSALSAATISDGAIKVHGYAAGPYQQTGTKIIGNTVRLPRNPTATSCLGIEVWGLAPHSVIANNSCYQGYMGISIDSSDYTTCTGNTSWDADYTGIEVAASERVAVTGNTVEGNANCNYGVVCSNSNTGYISITGNVFHDTSLRGVKVQTAPYTAISGNVMSLSNGYAIELLDSDYCDITGNVLEGNSAALKGVFCGRSNYPVIVGNRMSNFTQNGVLLYANTAMTYTNTVISANGFRNCGSTVDTDLSGGAALGSDIRIFGNAGISTGGKLLDHLDYANSIRLVMGTTSPEAAITASRGSLYLRTDGGVGSSLYVKQSGTSTTGWGAVGTQLAGSKTQDWASIADGARAITTVTVTGAALGDMAVASMSVDLQGMEITAYVSAVDTVTVVLRNGTGAPIDLASGTLRVKVLKAV